MKTKSLFKPKEYIRALSNDKIDAEPLFLLLGIIILTLLTAMFDIGSDGVNLIKTTLAPLNQINGPERLAAWFSVVAGMVVMAMLYLIVYAALITTSNYIVKAVLKLFKKEISLWKLINIALYTLLVYKFLVFVFTLCLTILSPLLKNISENQAFFITSLPLIIFNIGTFALYCYGIKWTTKNKFIPFL